MLGWCCAVPSASYPHVYYPHLLCLLFSTACEGSVEASPELAYTSIVDKIVDHGAPDVKATVPTTAGVFDKLTDSQQYTGGTVLKHAARESMLPRLLVNSRMHLPHALCPPRKCRPAQYCKFGCPLFWRQRTVPASAWSTLLCPRRPPALRFPLGSTATSLRTCYPSLR